MASGHGVPKPDKANHPNRQVSREAPAMSEYDRLHAKWRSGESLSMEESSSPEGQRLRRSLYGSD